MNENRDWPAETVGQKMDFTWGSIRVALGIPSGDVMVEITRSDAPVLNLSLSRDEAIQLAGLFLDYAHSSRVYRRG